jgi:nucleotide-binding universal stress UspA family protein
MLPFFFASPIAMELLKIYFRQRKASASGTAQSSGSDASLAAPQGAGLASMSRQFAGGNAMLRILVPVDGSRNSQFAVRHVIKEFMNNTAMEIHLLNVQSPFSRDVARFVSRKSLYDYHRDEAEKALGPVKHLLDGFSIPYSVHTDVGEKAKVITDTARRLHCDQIVMSTARKNSLTRLVEDSLTNRVIALTSVPVEMIAGDAVSKWERYGIPAGVGAALALILAVAD